MASLCLVIFLCQIQDQLYQLLCCGEFQKIRFSAILLLRILKISFKYSPSSHTFTLLSPCSAAVVTFASQSPPPHTLFLFFFFSSYTTLVWYREHLIVYSINPFFYHSCLEDVIFVFQVNFIKLWKIVPGLIFTISSYTSSGFTLPFWIFVHCSLCCSEIMYRQ